MKKALWFIAVAMMVLATACNKGKKDNNKPIDEEEGEELIQIDGQFADWAALQDVSTVKRNNAVSYTHLTLPSRGATTGSAKKSTIRNIPVSTPLRN